MICRRRSVPTGVIRCKVSKKTVSDVNEQVSMYEKLAHLLWWRGGLWDWARSALRGGEAAWECGRGDYSG